MNKKSKRRSRASIAAPRQSAPMVPSVQQGASSEQLSKLFDCTTRQIELWAAQKIVVRVSRGRYDAAQSTRNLVRHLREQAAGRAGVDPNSDTAEANRRKSEEQAAFTRAKRLRFEGELIEVVNVRALWSEIVAGVRQFMLGLPGQVVVKVPTLSSQDRREIEQLCRDGLDELALSRGHRLDGIETVKPEPEPSGSDV